MNPAEFERCRDLMHERAGEPDDFDHRGCRAVACGLAAFWIAAAAIVLQALGVFDLSMWQAFETVF